MSGSDVFSSEDFRSYADAYRGRDRLRGGFAQYRALLADGVEMAALLAQTRLPMPVLDVAAGAHGATSEEWIRLRSHADDLTVIAAPTGHFVAEEDPQWFVTELRDFLSGKLARDNRRR